MKKMIGAFGPASSKAGLKSTVARSVPFIAGLALSLVASAALAQSADGVAKKKRPPAVQRHRVMPVATPMATGPKVSVMGTLGGLNYSSTGSMSGTDTGAAPPTTTQSQGYNHTTVAGGGMMEIGGSTSAGGGLAAGEDPTTGGAPDCGIGFTDIICALLNNSFVATGFSDPGRATASFSGLSVIPKGTGTSFIKEEWSIPLYLGYRVQARRLGIAIPGLSFDVHGGVQFNEFKAGFNLVELGAPGGPGTAASKSWWEADPAVGVGARYQLGAGWFTGLDATWAFARSQNISAPSANFAPFENYTQSTGSRTLTAVMFNLGKTF